MGSLSGNTDSTLTDGHARVRSKLVTGQQFLPNVIIQKGTGFSQLSDLAYPVKLGKSRAIDHAYNTSLVPSIKGSDRAIVPYTFDKFQQDKSKEKTLMIWDFKPR